MPVTVYVGSRMGSLGSGWEARRGRLRGKVWVLIARVGVPSNPFQTVKTLVKNKQQSNNLCERQSMSWGVRTTMQSALNNANNTCAGTVFML